MKSLSRNISAIIAFPLDTIRRRAKPQGLFSILKISMYRKFGYVKYKKFIIYYKTKTLV